MGSQGGGLHRLLALSTLAAHLCTIKRQAVGGRRQRQPEASRGKQRQAEASRWRSAATKGQPQPIGNRLKAVIRVHQWSSKLISGHQGSSVVIRVHQWSSEFISGHQGSSVVIRVHQWSSGFISGHQGSSVVIRGHQWSSGFIRVHQWSSVVISRQQGSSVVIRGPLETVRRQSVGHDHPRNHHQRTCPRSVSSSS
jgi:hypothetical protein